MIFLTYSFTTTLKSSRRAMKCAPSSPSWTKSFKHWDLPINMMRMTLLQQISFKFPSLSFEFECCWSDGGRVLESLTSPAHRQHSYSAHPKLWVPLQNIHLQSLVELLISPYIYSQSKSFHKSNLAINQSIPSLTTCILPAPSSDVCEKRWALEG